MSTVNGSIARCGSSPRRSSSAAKSCCFSSACAATSASADFASSDGAATTAREGSVYSSSLRYDTSPKNVTTGGANSASSTCNVPSAPLQVRNFRAGPLYFRNRLNQSITQPVYSPVRVLLKYYTYLVLRGTVDTAKRFATHFQHR